MSYQFMHVEGYGRASGKGKSGGHTVASIVAEAERHPGACPHVAQPVTPGILFGVSPSEAARKAEAWAEASTDARGHRLRKDALCLLGGVVSAPENFESWDEYRTETLSWLQKRYGERLASVVEHFDEDHKHIHFYAVPLPGERFDVLHDGLRAASAADERGKRNRTQTEKAEGRKAARIAYAEAMRGFQDEFFQDVSVRYGMARLGPKRRRLSRATWKAEERERETQARALRQQIGQLREAEQLVMRTGDEVFALRDKTEKRAREVEKTARTLDEKKADAEKAVAVLTQILEKSNLSKACAGLSADEIQRAWMEGFGREAATIKAEKAQREQSQKTRKQDRGTSR